MLLYAKVSINGYFLSQKIKCEADKRSKNIKLEQKIISVNRAYMSFECRCCGVFYDFVDHDEGESRP